MKFSGIIILSLILLSCQEVSKKQFENAGGSFTMCLDDQPLSYISYNVEDYNSSVVLGQVLEGLVGINIKDFKIKPQLAKSWKISEDGLTYIFSLRKDVLFHPHEALGSESNRLFSSADVQATFEKICKKSEKGSGTNAYEYIFKESLKGAVDFHSGKTKEIAGLKISDHNVTIELNKRDDNFLFKLANAQSAILSKTMIQKGLEADMIGTGPFMFSEVKQIEDCSSIVLTKNLDYYEQDEQGNSLPYLNEIVFRIEMRKLEQLDLFEQKKIDVILSLPTSRITKMLDGRIADFNSNPPKLMLFKNALLATNYYAFNMEDERFKDVRVRKAFNYAIDRDKIGREILRNQYDELGYFGVVPPIQSDFRGYDFDKIRNEGYDYDPKKAKELLAAAGYPNGEGFGSITLRFNIGDVNSAVADEFAQQIFQSLGINVNIDGSTFEQLNSDATQGEGSIFKTSWYADYPNPETFLNNFYGKHLGDDRSKKSGINQSKYNNPEFDLLFEKAKNTNNLVEKMSLFSKAELELMKNPPLIPLWYAGDLQIVHSNVRNLRFNSLGLYDFKQVYKKDWTPSEYQESLTK